MINPSHTNSMLFLKYKEQFPHLFWDIPKKTIPSQEVIIDRTLRWWDVDSFSQLFIIIDKETIKSSLIQLLSSKRSDFPPAYLPFYFHYFGIDDTWGDIDSKTKRSTFFHRPIHW